MTPGIHAMLYALFDAEEQLDRAAMRRQVEIALASGAHGVCALGLATEVAKLRVEERRRLMHWVAEDVAGRAPIGFTIYGSSVGEQVEEVAAAQAAGAAWVILQPPMVGSFSGREFLRFFGRVADRTDLPVAIQNAPAYFGGRGLAAQELADLVAAHPNVRAVKGEGPVVDIRALIELTEGRLPVLNGRGGLELTDNLRAGCIGMILATDTIDRTVAIYERFRAGDEAGADALYADTLATIVFIMQSLESLVCYGKRIYAARAGHTVHDRAPSMQPTDFGAKLVTRHAAALGPFPRSGA
jgi:2-keto-3-deoxy-L-arabinonate dehydratase